MRTSILGGEARVLKSRLARRILVLFLSCALVPLLLITFLAYRQVIGSLRSQAYGRLHQQSKALAMSIVERLLFLQANLSLVATQVGADPAQPHGTPRVSEQFGGSFRSLFVMPASGPGVAILGQVEPTPDLSPAQLQHLALGRTLLVSQPLESAKEALRGRLAGALMGNVYLARALDPQDPAAGLLWARVDGEYLWGVGSSFALPYRTELCVAEGGGDILIRSMAVPNRLGREAVAATRTTGKRWFEWQNGDRKYLAGLWQIPMEANYLAMTWTVVVSEAKNDVLAPIADFKRDFPLSVLLSLWVVVLLGIIQIRRSLGPLLELQEATRRLANQDFSGRIEFASRDEFEELAEAFNAMSDRLGRQFHALSAMAAIGSAALSAKGVESVIRIALDGMHDFLPCDHASATVFDTDNPDQALSYLAPWSVVEGGRPVDSPISHSRQALPGIDELEQGWIHYDRSGSSRSDPFGLAASGFRSLLAVPLLTDGGLLGVLSLAAREQGAFESEHVRYAGEVADQLSVALHQARLQEQLQTERHRLAALLEHLPDGVVVLDADWRLVLTNQAVRSYLPSLAETTAGDRLATVGRLTVEEIAALPSGVVHELPGEGADRLVLQLVAGHLRQPPGATVLILRDVTRQRTIEERVKRQERLAAVGQLAAGISHDFNNILQGIVMASEVLRLSDALPPRLRQMARDITDEGHRGARLIRQILDFSRHATTIREPVDLVPLLEETTTLLRRTIPESVSVRLQLSDDECMVLADATQLQQVVTNLALNARDAMPEGGLFTIALSRFELRPGSPPPAPELRPGTWVRLTFSDTGCGIPDSARPHIFEPFFTTKEAGRGTGLGLAQVYGIVNQHGGQIEFDSVIDKGTTFTVHLPVLEVTETSPHAAVEVEPRHGAGETVLVVDDDPSLLRSTAAALEELGYRPLTARDGREALDLVENSGAEVAVILADVIMPEVGGVDILETLRESGPKVPVVLMSGYPFGHVTGELENLGVAGWLCKPFSLEQLAAAIGRALS